MPPFPFTPHLPSRNLFFLLFVVFSLFFVLFLTPAIWKFLTTKPSVVHTSPSGDAEGIAIEGTVILVDFDHPISLDVAAVFLTPPVDLVVVVSESLDAVEVLPLTTLDPDTSYTLSFDYANRWGFRRQSFSLSFSTRPVNVLENITPSLKTTLSSDSPVESSLLESFTLQFQFPLPEDFIVLSLSPAADYFLTPGFSSLVLTPTAHWEPETRYTVMVSPSENAPVIERFAPVTFSFSTTGDVTEQLAYEQVQEQEVLRQEESTEIQRQAEGDLLFQQVLEESIASDPRLNIINNLLPYDGGNFRVNHLFVGDSFAVGITNEAARQDALSWFERHGYTPDNILWIPFTP